MSAPPAPSDTRTPSGTSSSGQRHALQQEFFNRMGLEQQFQRLFDALPGLFFFVKDEQGRLICASQSMVERFGLRREADLVGSTDDEFFPPQIVDSFLRDDQQVIHTGRPLLNRVEIWYNEQRLLDWFVTTKLPVFDRAGRVTGIMGVVRSYTDKRKAHLPHSQISRAVEHIRTHHSARVRITELAKLTGISERQLHRKFHEEFGMNASSFLIKTRIQAAADALLRSDAPISQIAANYSFCDQSSFTRQFRQHTGLTPLRFRRKYRQDK